MAKNLRSGKLAVILHADVAGSTTLVQLNEQLAHERIQGAFRRFGETITKYHGRVRELRGDALLAEFERASDAVTAALAFQSEQIDFNTRVDDDIQLAVRVGIAMGEVIIADSTITGAGVVLAQRLEQLADSGGVVIQGAAHETVPRRLPLDYNFLGEREVKGFDEPVRAFSVSLRPGNPIPPPDAAAASADDRLQRWRVFGASFMAIAAVIGALAWWQPWRLEFKPNSIEQLKLELPDKPSIAVLPFDNLSGDPEQGYFADGIADDLITDLSKISGLVVIARNSSFDYRGSPDDLRQVARELGVRYLLEGSVRRASENVRINAQLIDTSTGQHVWSERYDQKLTNVFDIQDEVAKNIVSSLAVSLNTNEREYISQPHTANFDAYDLLLRAQEIQARFTPEDNAAGRALYEKAAQLDPGYARAHAGVALTHAIDTNQNWVDDRERSIRLGLEAVERALELDDTLAHAYFAQGSLFLAQRRHAEANKVGRRAVELAPNYADGHAQLAFFLINAGLHEEGLQALAHAKRLNPRYSQVYLYVEALALFHMERFRELVPLLQEAVERNAAFDRTHLLLAATYGQLGKLEEADWALQEATALLPNLSLADEHRDTILLRTEDLERYIDGLRRAGLRT